jgi:hypothetical protein
MMRTRGLIDGNNGKSFRIIFGGILSGPAPDFTAWRAIARLAIARNFAPRSLG